MYITKNLKQEFYSEMTCAIWIDLRFQLVMALWSTALHIKGAIHKKGVKSVYL